MPKMSLEEFRERAESQKDATPPQAGDSYRNFANQLLHIRGLVDDQVVFRRWSNVKGWIYSIEPLWYFDPSEGFTIKVKSDKKAQSK